MTISCITNLIISKLTFRRALARPSTQFSILNSQFSISLLFSLFALPFSLCFATPVIEPDRIYIDTPITQPSPHLNSQLSTPNNSELRTPNSELTAAAAAVTLSLPTNLPPIRAITFHLQTSPGNWYTSHPILDTTLTSYRIPLNNFLADGGNKDPITQATTLRTSLWLYSPAISQQSSPDGTALGGADNSKLQTSNFKLEGSTDAISVSASFAPPAPIALLRSGNGKEPVVPQASENLIQTLNKAQIDYDILTDDFTQNDLLDRTHLLLPHSPNLTKKQERLLLKYIKDGGKLIVYYSGNQTLAKALGINITSWKNRLPAWQRINLTEQYGHSRAIPYPTDNIIPPSPHQPKTTQILGYLDSSPSTPNSQFSILNSQLIPAFAKSRQGAWFAHLPPRPYPIAVDLIKNLLLDIPIPPPPAKITNIPTNKVVGAYITDTTQLYLNPEQTIAKYKSQKINTIYLPIAEIDKIPTLKKVIKESKKQNITLHAWVKILTTSPVLPYGKGPRKYIPKQIVNGSGWVDPAHKPNRDNIIQTLTTLVEKTGVDAIHLDYIRTPAGIVPQTKETTEAVTSLVKEISDNLRKVNPDIILSAAVFPTPQSSQTLNQDWPTWIKNNYISYVVPMIYTTSISQYTHNLNLNISAATPDRILPAIGTGADESQTDTPTTQTLIDISHPCLGITFFAHDPHLDELL